jgi:virginiamycin B lyase
MPALATETRGAPTPQLVPSPGQAFVFRFSPTTQTFESFAIPTAGAAPEGVAVLNRPGYTEVWFAESGADRIGRLIYTDTANYTLQEYGLATGSRPLNIVVDGSGRAWFTESGLSRIGRINSATGVSSEFVISTANVGLMDLAIAPNGSIWFTERGADRVGRLVVTSTTDYAVRDFTVSLTSNAGLAGIVVENDDSIWAALGNQNKLARLQPSVPRVDRTPALTPPPAYPFKLAIDPDGVRMWFTELDGNHITLASGSTLEYGLRYAVPTTDSRPYGLAVNSSGSVWFSEQLGGKIGRLVVTPTATFTEFPVLPLPRARVQGLQVDSKGAVWFVADSWHVVNLPLIMR